MSFVLLRREVLPFALSLMALALAATACDALLHLFNIVWIGRYLGIPGVLLIVFSFAYSLRKRKLIASGSPVTLLRTHERMAWAGSLLVLVHAGIHFNAVLAWLAVAAMVANVASGLTGKFLMQRARKRMDTTRAALVARGLKPPEVEEALYWESLTFDAIRQWRVVHYPVAMAFAVLALGHIASIFVFWGWA